MQVLTTANLNILRDLHLITGVSVSVWMQKWHVERQKAFINLHRETEEKARQPETKLLYAPEAAPDRVTDLVLDLRDLLLGGVVVHR
jgi:hypothetical protein